MLPDSCRRPPSHGMANGLAISGDYMSAASFLGIAGLVSLFGYDGLLYSFGFIVGWVVIVLLVAEPLRNSGKYTLSDVMGVSPAGAARARCSGGLLRHDRTVLSIGPACRCRAANCLATTADVTRIPP